MRYTLTRRPATHAELGFSLQRPYGPIREYEGKSLLFQREVFKRLELFVQVDSENILDINIDPQEAVLSISDSFGAIRVLYTLRIRPYTNHI